MTQLGIDLGGTSAKVALVNDKKEILRVGAVSTAMNSNPKIIVDHLAKVARTLMQGHRVSRVGVGVAGDIDFQKGVIRISPNLGWKNVPLRALLTQRLKRSVVVDNDANVAAWGIYKTQVPKSVKHLIVATLGTGVGGGIILNGAVHRGGTGSAGEIGHLTMIENGRRCNCGNLGCLEAYVGGINMVKAVKAALKKGQPSRLRALFKKDPKQITPFSIADAAKKGDRYAKSIWNEAGHILGIALGNLIYAFNPEMIVLTGGVAQAKKLILDPIREVLKKRTFRVPVGSVTLKVADKASHVGVLGASLL